MRKLPWFFVVFMFLTFTSCNDRGKANKTAADDEFTFAFLTDVHVEYGKRADIGLQQAIDHVNAKAPEFVVTGGDLISDALGQTEEHATELYDLWLEKEKGFEMPVYNTMGNHEEFGFYVKSGIERDHALYGDKMFESKVGKRFHTFTHKGWKFYIVDSIEETEERGYIGHVDSTQLKWLAKELEGVDSETPCAIVTHIPLITAQTQINEGSLAPNSKGMVVVNSKEVLDLFKDHNLKLVLQGHLHILEDVYINDIHFITGGAVSSLWWTGRKDGLEEGYLLVKVKGEDIEWEYVDFGWEVE
jgi:Icc protein